MKISEVIKLLNAEILTGTDFVDDEVSSAFGCDLMSDVLAFVKEQSALITGLVNPQVIRTAVMMDMSCVIFVRGKQPSEEMISLAEESGIVLLASKERMYPACGKLYQNGLSGGSIATE